MIKTLKSLLAKARTLLARFRTASTVVAGLAAQVVALGVLSGTALHVVQAVLAVATVVGAHVAAKPKAAPVK